MDLVSVSNEESEASFHSEDDDPPVTYRTELEKFREEWESELKKRSDHQNNFIDKRLINLNLNNSSTDKTQQAQALFLKGIESERSGRVYEALEFYRRAVQIVPDIEFQINYSAIPRDRTISESSAEVCLFSSEETDEDDDEDVKDLINKFHLLNKDTVCSPEYPRFTTHIKDLPVELIFYIVKWVVTSELDVYSLEQLAQVSRGFYLIARDSELWKQICLRTWGSQLGRLTKYGSWRDMYLMRPHLRFNGLYISQISYYRHGEQGLDHFYRPIHSVVYYRYIRFFPDGYVVLVTSAEEPTNIVSKMQNQNCKIQGNMSGYYKLNRDKISVVLTRKNAPEIVSFGSYLRRKKNRQQQNYCESKQNFHLELKLKNAGKRLNSRLTWEHYSLHVTRRGAPDEITDFEITDRNYPSLYFSPVKSYSFYAEKPL